MRHISFLVVIMSMTVPVAAATESPAGGATYMPGEVIVKLKDVPAGGIGVPNAKEGVGGPLQAASEAVAGARREAILRRLQARHELGEPEPVLPPVAQPPSAVGSRGSRPGAGVPHAYLLRTERGVLEVCAELSRDPDVEYAQPNYIYRQCRTPNDPDFPDQYAHQLIQMQDAWEISTGSRDIVIAVLDTGVDINHPDLKDNIWVNPGEIPNNGIDDDGNGYVDDVHGWNFGAGDNKIVPTGTPGSTASHGTQVAGVMAAVGNNGRGVSGVNWQSSIMVLRLSLNFTSKEIAGALDYAAANGAWVANMSFGGDSFGPDGDRLVKTAIDNAFAQGVLLVASAGNSDTSRPHYPAAYPNVMAVASTDGEDTKTGHSTFGPWVDIAAPGTDIVTTNLGNNYIATAGTSFSGPYVAAVAALVFAHRPTLTPIQVRAILENTTDPVYYGDLDPDLWYIGTGRVNAYQALQGADRGYPLGEIALPVPRQTYAADVETLDLRVFVHGGSYQLDYRLFGAAEWIALAQGASVVDPNGMVHVSLTNPGVGTYELRLRVTAGGSTHTDRKIFGVDLAPAQARWPKPTKVDDTLNEYFIGSPLCLDITGDGRQEVLQASIDFTTSYWGVGKINAWYADGNSLPNWPVKMGNVWPTSLAVGDIDGDGDYEVIVAGEYDGVVSAYHVHNGRVVAGHWPVTVGRAGYIVGGPVLVDLDGDSVSEVLIALDAESRNADGLIALKGDGSHLWQRRYTSEGPISVADINKDGKPEIALCGYGPGLTRVYTFILDAQGQQLARWRGGSKKGTVVADLDGDGTSELIFCTEEDVQAARLDGSTVWRTPIPAPFDSRGGLSVGDLDGDGFSEVYVNNYLEVEGFIVSRVYAFDHRGRPRTAAGFPKTIMGDPTRCVPLIADLDGDGKKELIVGSSYEPLMAWGADGAVKRGFPLLRLNADMELTPTLADLDGDGDLELMLAADDYRFHVLDLPGSASAGRVDWGMARRDPQNSGWTAPVPRLDPIAAPAEIKPGTRLQVQATATNPANLPLRWAVGNLPEGASYNAQSRTLFWKPTTDQVFRSYTLSFLVTDGIRQDSRSVAVTVVPDAIYYATMDTHPGWTLDPGWAWGKPAGKGSWNADPAAGRTGDSVLGYALDGDYENDLPETRYATTGPIDCRGYKNIRLSFWRWLGVESPYDYACIQVSPDGQTWTDLWTTGVSRVSDRAWQFVEYAVPAGLADGRATVYFRWGLGPTDDIVTYPGWNIDDVQVTGDRI